MNFKWCGTKRSLPSFRRTSAFGTRTYLSHERDVTADLRPMKPQVQTANFVHLRQTALLYYLLTSLRFLKFSFHFPLLPFLSSLSLSFRQSVMISSFYFHRFAFQSSITSFSLSFPCSFYIPRQKWNPKNQQYSAARCGLSSSLFCFQKISQERVIRVMQLGEKVVVTDKQT